MCHVPFMSAGEMSGQFDIMPELYRAWNAEVAHGARVHDLRTRSLVRFWGTRTQSSRIITPIIVASSRRDGIGATAVIRRRRNGVSPIAKDDN